MRDIAGASNRLLEIANSSSNKALEPSFKAFRDLTPALREALVSSMTVLDQQEDIGDYRQKIRQHIRSAVHTDQVDALLERVEGWWFDRVVAHLLHRVDNPFISVFELNEKIASIAETFHEGNLPVDFLDAMPEEGYHVEHMDKMYVRQLQALNVKERVVGKAILDFYRAFEQRTRWLEESLIFPGELMKYELRLVDEWERYFDSREAELAGLATEEDFRVFGIGVLNWAQLQTEHLRIKAKVDADFVRRGSFHMLADKPSPQIYWHPRFLDELKKAVSAAANPT